MTTLAEIKVQQEYFNRSKNQYPSNLIISPPRHVLQELKQISDYLNSHRVYSVIDFGAGTGRLTIFLLKLKFQVLAIDVSELSLQLLKKLVPHFDSLRLETAKELPKKKYQAIVGSDILHHINLDCYLPLFHHCLEKEGKLVFSEPGAWNPSWYLYLPLTHSWEVEKGIRSCSYLNLKRKLKQYGYRNIKIKGLGLFPRFFFQFSEKLCMINDALGNLPFFKMFAYRYIITAEK